MLIVAVAFGATVPVAVAVIDVVIAVVAVVAVVAAVAVSPLTANDEKADF